MAQVLTWDGLRPKRRERRFSGAVYRTQSSSDCNAKLRRAGFRCSGGTIIGMLGGPALGGFIGYKMGSTTWGKIGYGVAGGVVGLIVGAVGAMVACPEAACQTREY